jgi:DNA repair exonuclease SbcCD ATPase subunit
VIVVCSYQYNNIIQQYNTTIQQYNSTNTTNRGILQSVATRNDYRKKQAMAITTAQIHAAADQIDKEGKRPTLAGVRTVLGGGSFSTIQEAMKSWSSKGDEDETPAEPIPAEVADEGERLTAAIWQLAEKHAAAAYDAEREDLRKDLEDAKRETQDATAAADEEANKFSQAAEELEKAKEIIKDQINAIAIIEDSAKDQEGQIRYWMGLAEERAKTVKMLEQILSKRPKAAAPAAKKV